MDTGEHSSSECRKSTRTLVRKAENEEVVVVVVMVEEQYTRNSMKTNDVHLQMQKLGQSMARISLTFSFRLKRKTLK